MTLERIENVHTEERQIEPYPANGHDQALSTPPDNEFPIVKLTPEKQRRSHPGTDPQQRAKEVASDQDLMFRGTRTPDDFIAADSFEVHIDHSTIDNQTQVQVGILDDYPRETEVGWLENIYEQAGVTTVVDIKPENSDDIIKMLMRREGAIDEEISERVRHHMVEQPKLTAQKKEVHKLLTDVAEGRERVFSTEILVRMEADGEGKEGKAALGEVRRGVELPIKAHHTRLRIPYFRQEEAFRTASLTGYDGLNERRNVHTSALASIYPGSRKRIQMENGVLIGFTVGDPSSPVLFDGMDLDMYNGNGGFFGTAGSTKSSSMKVWMLRHIIMGTQAIVFQPAREAHGEYYRACRFAEGFHFDMSPGSRGRINFLEMPPFNPDNDDTLDPYSEQMEYLPDILRHMLQDKVEATNSPKPYSSDQEAVVRRAIARLYERFHFYPEEPENYQYLPSPKFPDLRFELAEMARDGDEVLELDNPQNAEEYKRIAGTYANAALKYMDSAIGRIFSEDTNIDMDRPMVVFDMGRLPESFKQQAYLLAGRMVWNAMRRDPNRERIWAADEIQVALGDRPDDPDSRTSRELFTTVAEQIRKNNGMFWLATQRIGNLNAHEAGNRILNNLSWRYILGQNPQGLEELKRFFRFSKPELDVISLGRKNKGIGVFMVGTGEQGGTRVIMQVKRTPLETYITSTTRREQLDLADLSPTGEGEEEVSASTLKALID